MSDITAIWERVEMWYASQDASSLLNAGASVQEIQAVEAEFGLTFPGDFRESFLRHNGVEEGGWPTGDLLSLEGLQRERSVWMGLMNDGSLDHRADHDASEGTEEIQPGWWNAGWIPLEADGGGNGYVVDLNPGLTGTIGQILDMDHEVGPNGPVYSSFPSYLEDIAQGLESDKYIYHEGSVVEAADIEDEDA